MPAITRYLQQADDELAETPAVTVLLTSAARVESRGISTDDGLERAGQLLVDLGAAAKDHATRGEKFKKPITYLAGKVDEKRRPLRDKLSAAAVVVGRIVSARNRELEEIARKEARRIEEETRKRLEAIRDKEAKEIERKAKAAKPAERKDLRAEAAERREEPVHVAPAAVTPAARKIAGTREVTRWHAELVGDTDDERWTSLSALFVAVTKGQVDSRAVEINWEYLNKQAGPEMNRIRMGSKVLPFPGVHAVSETKTETTGRGRRSA